MTSKPEIVFKGSGVSPGVVLGQALKIDSHNRLVLKIHVDRVEEEANRYLRAIEAATRDDNLIVIIPQKNFQYSIDVRDYKIEVVPAATLDDYLKECLVEQSFVKVPAQKRRQ